jgi:hypothetical protein
MTTPKSYRHGDHLTICDSCGAERYRSECSYTWDGYLMCHIRNCWYPKDYIFEIPPVINDPAPIFDTRPGQAAGTETYVDNLVGLINTFSSCHQLFGTIHKGFGQLDSPPDYIGS